MPHDDYEAACRKGAPATKQTPALFECYDPHIADLYHPGKEQMDEGVVRHITGTVMWIVQQQLSELGAAAEKHNLWQVRLFPMLMIWQAYENAAHQARQLDFVAESTAFRHRLAGAGQSHSPFFKQRHTHV